MLLAERLGRNIELTVDVGGAQLIVLTSGRHGVGEGDTVTMRIAESDVHVFTPGEGDTDAGSVTRPWRQCSERRDGEDRHSRPRRV